MKGYEDQAHQPEEVKVKKHASEYICSKSLKIYEYGVGKICAQGSLFNIIIDIFSKTITLWWVQ